MSELIHKGIRPVNPLLRDFEGFKVLPGFWIEPLGDTWRYWSNRELSSGCGGLIMEPKEREGLLYCPFCDEWFTDNQFILEE